MLRTSLAATLAACLAVPVALAQAPPEQPQATLPAEQPGTPSSTLPACQLDRLFPDAFGQRAALERKGVCIGLTDINEILGNPSGGVRQGALYEGATLASLGVDLNTAGLPPGGVLNISGWQLRGHGLSANNLLNLQVASSIEAAPTWRLFELWYDTGLRDNLVSVRIGQQSSDTEFITSLYAQLFVNSGFGFPTLAAADLPGGGSEFPLATPAVRVRVRPNDTWVLQAGVYSGSPAGTRPGDPQLVNRTGLLFPVGPGATWIGEVQANVKPFGHEGTYKLGAWYNDNVYTEVGSPDLSVAVHAHNNWSIYAVADQLLWRKPGAEDGGIGTFLRVMGAPGGRNAISFFMDGGVTWRGIVPGRDNDTAGIGFGFARVGSALRDAAAAQNAVFPSFPTRSGELLIEASYQAVVVPGWTLQPFAQFINQPGGSISDPASTAPNYRRIGNETVLGLRSTVAF